MVALAGRVRQPGVRLDLGDRIIPMSCDEAFQRATGVIVGKGPAGAEFLADPNAGLEGGPGLIEPVERYKDVCPEVVDRKAVSQPRWAVVGQPYGVVDDLQRVAKIPAQFRNLRERDHGDARGEV